MTSLDAFLKDQLRAFNRRRNDKREAMFRRQNEDMRRIISEDGLNRALSLGLKNTKEIRDEHIREVWERRLPMKEMALILGVNLSTLWRHRKRLGLV